jgi:hypothetical protein
MDLSATTIITEALAELEEFDFAAWRLQYRDEMKRLLEEIPIDGMSDADLRCLRRIKISLTRRLPWEMQAQDSLTKLQAIVRQRNLACSTSH